MINSAEGIVTTTPEGGSIRYERRLHHPIDKVWAALTERDRLAEWLGEGDIEPRPGGRVHIAFTVVDPPAILESVVEEYDPPHLLQYAFGSEGDGVVRFELTEDGAETRLVLIYSKVAPAQMAGNGAGWHIRIDMLVASLDSGMQQLPWDRMPALNTRYEALVDAVLQATTAESALAEVVQAPEGGSLRFVRTYRHPIDQVWDAITVGDRLAAWMAPAEIDLVPGGAVKIVFPNAVSVIESTVIELDPPYLFSYRWISNGDDYGVVRWELASTGDATLLTMTHAEVPNDREAGLTEIGAGWHVHLDALTQALALEPVAFDWAGWDRNLARYQEIVTTR